MNATLLVIGTAVTLTLFLSGALFILLKCLRQSRSPALRIFAATASVVVLVLAPWCLDAIVVLLNATRGVMYVSVDPGWVIKILPSVTALVVATALVRRTSPHKSQQNTGIM